jgi:hypothetical protein
MDKAELHDPKRVLLMEPSWRPKLRLCQQQYALKSTQSSDFTATAKSSYIVFGNTSSIV